MSAKELKGYSYERSFPYIMILPSVIAMSLIHFLPSIIGILMSFTNFDATSLRNWSNAKFVGLENYMEVFQKGSQVGDLFIQSASASFTYTIFSLIGVYGLGLVAALALNCEGKIYRLLRGVFLISWVLPNVVSVFIWKSMFMRDLGPINKILMNIGLIKEPVFWMLGFMAIVSVIITNVWKAWPFAFISLLAGLQSIPKEMYDAASVDGASAFQRFKYITFPFLYPVSRILVLLLIVWTALDFTTIYIFYGYSPPPSANVVPVYVYNMAFQTWNFGAGAAMSVILMLIMLVICAVYIRVLVDKENK